MCRNRRIWLAAARQHDVRSAARWVFPGLDVIFCLAAGAIDILVEGAAAHTIEAADDKAGIDALRPGLDAGDDALDTIPACGAIVEFLEAALLHATRAGGVRGRAGFQRGDVSAQRGGRCDAEDIIEPLGPAEPQHLGRAIVAVGAQQDLHARPVLAQRRDQATQPEDDLPPARPAGGAQGGGDHATLAIEGHDGLEAVFFVVSVE